MRRPRKPGPSPHMREAAPIIQKSERFQRVVSDDDALLIRQFARNARKALGPDRQRLPKRFNVSLADMFNCSKSTVQRIIAKKTYRHVRLSWRRWG